MKKIVLLSIDENGDIDIMRKSISVDDKIMKEILKTYGKLNISKKENKEDNDYTSIFKYDYSKKSSLDVNSYAKI